MKINIFKSLQQAKFFLNFVNCTNPSLKMKVFYNLSRHLDMVRQGASKDVKKSNEM